MRGPAALVFCNWRSTHWPGKPVSAGYFAGDQFGAGYVTLVVSGDPFLAGSAAFTFSAAASAFGGAF
jgi:hypothetical protein